MSLQSPKTEFGAQNQDGRVIYPSFFTWSIKKYTFGGQKGKNRLPKPKNGIWDPKSKSKGKNKLAILEVLVDFKRKNTNVCKFSIAIMKLNFLEFIFRCKYFHLENSINTKRLLFF
jgi:hypothetical protein